MNHFDIKDRPITEDDIKKIILLADQKFTSHSWNEFLSWQNYTFYIWHCKECNSNFLKYCSNSSYYFGVYNIIDDIAGVNFENWLNKYSCEDLIIKSIIE